MSQKILTALVENKAGVLSRISSLFRRRSFNIDSLTVGKTSDPEFSWMTISVDSKKTNIIQVEKQLQKLINILEVFEISKKEDFLRETVLVKISFDSKKLANVSKISEKFSAKKVKKKKKIIFELTDDPKNIENFISEMKKLKIYDFVRTGITAVRTQ